MEIVNLDRLNTLIKNRRELVSALKKNNDKSHELLAEGLYKRREHFISELLQNAEDEGAHTVSFVLNDNELIFSHDSSNYFDFDDIQSISNFGDNKKKKNKTNAIGRFGIGFKSVYSVTDTPRIISGDFDISITEMCVPENNNPENVFYGTKIILPFRQRESVNIANLLEEKFKVLDIHYLLFLSNIKSIKWETPNATGKYEKNIVGNNGFIELQANNKTVSYLMFEKKVNIEEKSLVIKIAFELNSSRTAIIKCNKSPLFAFFPTAIETGLNFLLHAPFHTTESRENLDEMDSRNELLQKELSVLFVEKLSDIKRLNFINTDFFNLMPIDSDVCSRNNIYDLFYKALLNELKKTENEFLPTTEKNIFASVNNVMLLGSSELSELLTAKQAKAVWNRSNWITSEITEARAETRKLYQYLHNDLSIPNNDLRSFSTSLNEEFLLSQSNNWLVKFYKIIYEKAAGLWERDSKNSVLRKRPIMRIEKDGKTEQVFPFKDDGKPSVYLPLEVKTNYPTVLSSIAKDKKVEEFLKAFGLDYPDVFTEINEIILSRLKSGVIYDGFFDDISTLIRVPNEETKKKILLNDLRSLSFISGVNHITNTEKLLKCNEIYFPTNNLISYFENNENVYFVKDIEIFTNEQKEKYYALLNELGVESICPRKIPFSPTYSNDEKKKLISLFDIRSHSQIWQDYKLDGLDIFLESALTKEKSILLWNLLSKQDINFFHGHAKWFYRYQYDDDFDAFFIRELRKTPWIFIDESKRAPIEISFENLSEEYKQNIVASNKFTDILHFRLDEDREYEKKHKGKKVVDAAEWEELQKLKTEKEAEENAKKKQEEEKIKFKPSVNAADAPFNVSTYTGTGKNTSLQYTNNNHSSGENKPDVNDRNDKYSNDMDHNNQNDSDLNSEKENSNDNNNAEYIKDIGRWGEEYVLRILRNETLNDINIEITDLNSDGKTGVGADFEIKRNGVIVKLVEVKSTTSSKGNPLIISGTQWETARGFYNLDNGDIYWIYCVYNAGKENVQVEKVQNPIKQWKNGKIAADPINFVLEAL